MTLVFKMFIDSTVTLSNCHQCPIMLTLANFDPELQASTVGKVYTGGVPALGRFVPLLLLLPRQFPDAYLPLTPVPHNVDAC